MAYPALRTTKEDDDVDFSFFFADNTLHVRSSRSTRARYLVALGALGAKCLSMPRIAFANETQERNVK